MLPGVNGFKICQAIHRDSELGPLVKILAITGYDTPENRALILAAGAHAYLAKPFRINEFFDELEKLGMLYEGKDS